MRASTEILLWDSLLISAQSVPRRNSKWVKFAKFAVKWMAAKLPIWRLTANVEPANGLADPKSPWPHPAITLPAHALTAVQPS